MTPSRDHAPVNDIRDIVVKKTTAAQQVADGLSELILSGKVTPGQRLREAAIAAELGVARNTMREAIRLLEIAGLVHIEVNRGVVAISPTPESLKSLYSARLVLETSAVRDRRAKHHVEHVRQAYDRLIASAKTRDVAAIVRDDLAFHAAIVRMLDSPRIDHFYDQLVRELRFYLVYLCVQDKEFERSAGVVDEHYPIMKALEEGSAKAAREEIEKHIVANHNRVGELIFKNLNGTSVLVDSLDR
ncbi:GntR family transcriptional regulator [Bradyrhizobium sp.]|uniref:GntR family transcriptional regulator n=1 Tax=Bradyrhizobium sp. TaxID=376 RepID=UPI0039E4C693